MASHYDQNVLSLYLLVLINAPTGSLVPGSLQGFVLYMLRPERLCRTKVGLLQHEGICKRFQVIVLQLCSTVGLFEPKSFLKRNQSFLYTPSTSPRLGDLPSRWPTCHSSRRCSRRWLHPWRRSSESKSNSTCGACGVAGVVEFFPCVCRKANRCHVLLCSCCLGEERKGESEEQVNKLLDDSDLFWRYSPWLN